MEKEEMRLEDIEEGERISLEVHKRNGSTLIDGFVSKKGDMNNTFIHIGVKAAKLLKSNGIKLIAFVYIDNKSRYNYLWLNPKINTNTLEVKSQASGKRIDRRLSERVKTNLNANVMANDAWESIQVTDISKHGCKIKSQRELGIIEGDTASIVLNRKVYECEVRWRQDIDNNEVLYGMLIKGVVSLENGGIINIR